MRQKTATPAAGAIFSRLEIKVLSGLVIAAFVGSALSMVFAQDLSSDRIEATLAHYAAGGGLRSARPVAEATAHD
jgi:hypothetical protein